MNFLKLFKMRHVTLLWGSQVLSAVGDQLFLIAMMWTLVKQAGDAAGTVLAAGSTSALICGLVGGVLADRWNRSLTMMIVDVVRAFAVFLLPLLAWWRGTQFWQFLLVAILVETLGVLFDPALQASLPHFVESPEVLHATNGLMDATRRLARILGPGMAGLLLFFLPLIHFFTFDAVTFLLSALAIFALRHRLAQKSNEVPYVVKKKQHIFADVKDGFQLVRRHQPLLWALVAIGISNLVWGTAFTVGTPLLVSHVLSGNAGTYGLIVGAFGVGNIISTLAVGSFTIRHRIRFSFLGRIVMGIGYLIFAMATNVWMALLGSALAALGGPMAELPLLTMIQTDFPSTHVGKVYSLRMTVANLGFTFGLLLAAPLFSLVYVSTAIGLCAVLLLVTGMIGFLRFRTQRSAVQKPSSLHTEWITSGE